MTAGEKTSLVKPNDLPWVIERVRTTPDAEGAKFRVRVVQTVYRRVPAPVEAILQVMETVPPLEEAFGSLFAPVALDSPAAVHMRQLYHQQAADVTQMQPPQVLLRLGRDREVRLVESGEQPREVIMESISGLLGLTWFAVIIRKSFADRHSRPPAERSSGPTSSLATGSTGGPVKG